MGKTSVLWRIRYWFAFSIFLPVFYVLIGSEPMFCDFASDKGCVLEKAEEVVPRTNFIDDAYRRAMWAIVMAAGGQVRIPTIIQHDAPLLGSLETYTEPDGTYVYIAKP